MIFEENDSAKFQEAIIIILEFAISQNIDLTEIVQYLDNDLKTNILIKHGLQSELINYLINIPRLQELCQVLNLQSFNYNMKDIQESEQNINKKMIFYKLFKQINKMANNEENNIFTQQFQDIQSENQVPDREIINENSKQSNNKETNNRETNNRETNNKETNILSNVQTDYEEFSQYKPYILGVLNQIAEQCDSYPQILYALHMEIRGEELRFMIQPNRKFIQIIKELVQSEQLKPVKFPLDEVRIIEKILHRTYKSQRLDQIAHYNDDQAKTLFDQINQIEYSKYNKSLIYERLVKLQNKIKHKVDNVAQKKYLLIALGAYLMEYVNRNQAVPDMIKYIQIHRTSQFKQFLCYKTNINFYRILKTNCEIPNISDIEYNEKAYRELEMKYPEFTNFNNIDMAVGKMLKLIYGQRDSIKGELVDLFSQKKVHDFIFRVRQLDPIIIKQRSFETLLDIESYVVELGKNIPEVKDVAFVSSNEKRLARWNINVVLKMIVEKDIALPDLISYMICVISEKKRSAIALSGKINVYNFVENDKIIGALLRQYGVPENDRYRLLNIDSTKLEFQHNYSEAVCIIKILQAIQREKSQHRERLYQIFQEKSVQYLMIQLKKFYQQYENDPILIQAFEGYKILKDIRSATKDIDNSYSDTVDDDDDE